MTQDHFVSWLHIGDLHASDEDGWESVDVLQRIVAAVQTHVPSGTLDFAFLPGDNANHGEAAQYARVSQALATLDMPRYAIPGDHDFEPGSLERFNEALGTLALPAALRIAGRRAIFLDIVSAGGGGPDFRIGDAQTGWLRRELEQARTLGEPRPLVFMHAFPADLKQDARAIGRLFADAQVAFVDTGHTHYNELLNDGAVIYSATRSTGQIEEGPAGFAVAAVDGEAASWGFKSLDSPWPWVLVTSPADRRLTVTGRPTRRQERFDVRALVLGRDIATVEVVVDGKVDGPADGTGDGPGDGPVSGAMQPMPGRPGRWTVTIDRPLAQVGRVRVEARGADGTIASDTIELADRSDIGRHVALGDHSATVGPWAEHGLMGTRLGPNANGKDW